MDTATSADATPLQGLNRLMSGASAGGDLREQGAQAYRKALEEAARRGDQIDTFWDRYASSCVTRAARAGDRAWFAVYEPNGPFGLPAPPATTASAGWARCGPVQRSFERRSRRRLKRPDGKACTQESCAVFGGSIAWSGEAGSARAPCIIG